MESLLRPVGSFFDGAAHYRSLESSVARLRAENGSLERRYIESVDVRRKLKALLSEEHLAWAGNLPSVMAEVVGGATSNFELTVVIDKGRSQGVNVGMSVVSGAGLIGRVIEASSSSATVLLVTDPRSSVGVRFGPSGVLGVASGAGAGHPLTVGYVPPGTALKKGEVMFTSGLQNALFPPGVPVGRVSSFSSSSGAVQERIELKPLADLSHLQYVDVLEWQPPP
jgi:rod shape-determining protein MreC